MDKKQFETIYEKYGECTYPKETADSVRRCYVSYEEKDRAIKAASSIKRLTKKEAMDDVIDFFNCLKRSYCGYDYFFTDELCDQMQESLFRKIKLCPVKIRTVRLCYYIYHELADLLNDSHFELHLNGTSRFFRKKYYAYVTDLILRKIGENYKVINETPDFPKGHLFSGDEVRNFLLPTLYVGDDHPIDDKYYLLGEYSLTEINELVLQGKRIKTHRILSDLVPQSDETGIVSKNDYCIVNHNSYGMPWNEALLQEYYNDGRACANSNAIILNLTNNGGGCSDYPQRFYTGLNGNGENGFYGAYLPNPTELPEETKCYRMDYPASGLSSTYDGTLYVVMNKATASSAEMGVSSSYYVKNAIRVGSASSGCGTFGNLIMFQLPNSKIIFCFGHRLFHHEKFEEGKGFLPDYWIDDKDPVGVVERYIKQKAQHSLSARETTEL